MSDTLLSNQPVPSAPTPELKDEKKADSVSVHIAEGQSYDAKETKRLLRKLDWHLIPFMSLIYL